MLRSLYIRVMVLASSPNAAWWLALIAFAESSFFPIPPDALLVPMALAKPRSAWKFAAICTAASVCGGALGYLIGFAVFDQVAQPLLRLYGYGASYAAFQAKFQEYGLWIILIKGLTPIPYKIVTIAAGAARFDFVLFMLASAATRGARFFLVATLLHFFGDSVRVFIERRLTLVTSALAVGIVGGFLALKFL
ncbi:MAG TPA: cytochrome B [Acetobacteraceae bacterium]|jgi:membrane protein YqaA with SNARE-associated domain|nr:cytochrome B [Acetobacteraceae bacterium]